MHKINYFLLGLFSVLLMACDTKPKTTEPAAKEVSIPLVVNDAHILAGKTLHDNNCISCHDSSVYNRSERRLNSYSELLNQVRHCEAHLAERLYDQEIQQIALYLNKTYYQFDQP